MQEPLRHVQAVSPVYTELYMHCLFSRNKLGVKPPFDFARMSKIRIAAKAPVFTTSTALIRLNRQYIPKTQLCDLQARNIHLQQPAKKPLMSVVCLFRLQRNAVRYMTHCTKRISLLHLQSFWGHYILKDHDLVYGWTLIDFEHDGSDRKFSTTEATSLSVPSRSGLPGRCLSSGLQAAIQLTLNWGRRIPARRQCTCTDESRHAARRCQLQMRIKESIWHVQELNILPLIFNCIRDC